MTSGPIIEVDKLVKVYPGGVVALKGLSFSISSRGVTILVGPNGAGKTTLIKILTTILKPTRGCARILGYDVVRDYRVVRRLVSLVPQEGEPDRYLTPWEHVYYYLRARGLSDGDARRLAREALELVGLWERRNVLCARLSGGQRRRTLIAMALAVPAEVYFLDEPTIGLDPIARRGVWEILMKIAKDHVIFLTTHYMEEAEYLGSFVLMINEGRLVASGTPRDLIASLGYRYKVVVHDNVDRVKDIVSSLEGRVGGVATASYGGNVVVYAKDDSELTYILRLLVESKVPFSVRPVTLEDVFMRVLGGGGSVSG